MEHGGGRGGRRSYGRSGPHEGRGGRAPNASFGQRGRGGRGFAAGSEEPSNGYGYGGRGYGGRSGRGGGSDGQRAFDAPQSQGFGGRARGRFGGGGRGSDSSGQARGRGDGGPRPKRNNGPPQTPLNLDEAFTMMVHSELQSLVDDGTRFELSFPKDLDNHQRRYIHSMAEKYGLFTKSSGKGDNRFIHVAKVKKNANMQEISLRLRPIQLNASTVSWFPPPVIEYLQRYPLTNGETADSWASGELTPSWNAHHAGDQHRRTSAPLFKPLKTTNAKTNGSQQPAALNTGTLPVHSYRQQILELVERNQIVVISGDTGCGKSTQIPQFLLDDMIQRGERNQTRIICSQPRRLSAISLAERVAKERSGLGSDPLEVGHAIRFDAAFDPNKSKLIFCTTGTLLKWLNSDPLALGFSHLILDEVHERDQFTDFLLILLKSNILHKRKDLKVILMSATIQVEKFSRYFQPEFEAPILEMVGGRCFPVTTLHLEDVLALIHHANTGGMTLQKDPYGDDDDDEDSHDGDEEMPPADSGLVCPMCQTTGFADEAGFGMHLATCFGQPVAPPPPPSPKKEKPAKKKKAVAAKPRQPTTSMGEHLQHALVRGDAAVKTSLLDNYVRQEDALSRDQSVDYSLLLQLLCMIEQVFPRHKAEFEGAILVFLPGWEEISYMERELLRSHLTASTYEIAMLHSRLSAQEQRRAFLKPPRGKRKLILATNIAETSLTIEDVVFVIDCGKSKQAHALATTSSSSFVMGLQTTWVAKANCVQRMGRAGRVRPGVCFRLFSQTRYDTSMKEFMLPELLTTPLEELLLHIKLLQYEKKLHIRDAKEFLMRAMDSPSETSIDASLDRLEAMKALDKGKQLTLLGWHLAHICDSGVSVHVGKLLLWSHMLGSFESIVRTTCALSGYRDPFLNFLGMTSDELKQVEMAKQAFLRDAGAPFPVVSDHFVLLLAMDGFLQFHPRAHQEINSFCQRNMLHRPTLEQVTSIYRQLERDLELLGMSPDSQLVASAAPPPARQPYDRRKPHGVAAAVQWPRERLAPFFMALGGGMYPNVLFTRPTTGSRNWTSKEKVKVRLDSSSMLAKANPKKEDASDDDATGNSLEWLVYHEMMQSERTRVAKNASKLPSVLILLLLVGSNDQLRVDEQTSEDGEGEDDGVKTWHLTLDDWIVFEFGTQEELQAILMLRARLQAAFYRHLDRLHESHQLQQLQFQREHYQQRGHQASVPDEPKDPMLAVWKTHDEALASALVAWVASDL